MVNFKSVVAYTGKLYIRLGKMSVSKAIKRKVNRTDLDSKSEKPVADVDTSGSNVEEKDKSRYLRHLLLCSTCL